MSKKENANQKLEKWMNHTYIETEDKKKPFFEGYKPNGYFNTESENLTETQIQNLISKAILTGKDKFASCTSMSKPITLDDLDKLTEKLNQLPPVPIEIEIGKIAWLILSNQLNIDIKYDRDKINKLFGVNIVIYQGNDIKFNQMKVKYNNGDSKVINVFEYNCNDFIYKNIFEEDR